MENQNKFIYIYFLENTTTQTSKLRTSNWIEDIYSCTWSL